MSTKFILWIGKFIYPNIDIKHTKIKYVPNCHYYRVDDFVIELKMFVYIEKINTIFIRMYYNNKNDTVYIVKDSLRIEKTNEYLYNKTV